MQTGDQVYLQLTDEIIRRKNKLFYIDLQDSIDSVTTSVNAKQEHLKTMILLSSYYRLSKFSNY